MRRLRYNTSMPKFFDARRLAKFLVVIGVLIFTVSGWLWWSRVYNNPSRVFWSMLDNSLATTSVTRRIKQGKGDQLVDRYVKLSLGADNVSRVVETRKQSDGVNKSTIVQESIGTPSSDYISFPYINTNAKTAEGRNVDYAKVQGVWGKSIEAQSTLGSQAQNFSQALLGTVAMGNLSRVNRKILVGYMHDKKVYDVDFNKVVKAKYGGKSAYFYPVEVSPKSYFSMLQQFAAMSGLGQIPGLDPSQYEDAAALNVEFIVDINSRQLADIRYVATKQDEVFSSYGSSAKATLPKTTIPVAELERRIQSLQ